MKTLFIAVTVFWTVGLWAQPSLQRIWQTEATLKFPEAVVFEPGGKFLGQRYFTNHSTSVTVDLMRLGVLRKPCPSSANSISSVGTPRLRRLFTTCSASTKGTLVSLLPCCTRTGALTRSILWMGESCLSK